MSGWRNNDFPAETVRDIAQAVNEYGSADPPPAIKFIGTPEDIRAKKAYFFLEHEGVKYFVKIFNNNSPGLLFRDILRCSKALKFYSATFVMKKREINVPKPVFMLEKKFLFFNFTSVICTTFIDDALPFTEDYRKNSEQETDYYLERLADFLLLLKRKQVCHTDLLGNILIKRSSGIPEFYLIDIDAVKLFDNLTRFDYIKHFEGFYDFFVKKEGFSEKDWWKFLDIYLSKDPSMAQIPEALTEDIKNRKNLIFYVFHTKK